jgi:alpha-D-xyloside xylohydrolase
MPVNTSSPLPARKAKFALLVAGAGAALAALFAASAFAAPIAVTGVERDAHGLTLQMKPGLLRLEVYTPRVIRVTYTAGEQFPNSDSLAVIAKPADVKWTSRETKDDVVLRTDEIEARVHRATGAVSFFDKKGAPLLEEISEGGKSLTPNTINGQQTLRSRQEFVLAPDEAVYGLGQHQIGRLNYRGAVVHLQQKNPTESAVPVLVSSRGYGILWDNPAITDVNVAAGQEQAIPADRLFTAGGKPGGLTAHYFRGVNFDTPVATRTDARVDFDWSDTPPPGLAHDGYSVRWEGFVQAGRAGIYTFDSASDDGVRLWIDDRKVIDAWSIHPAQTESAAVTFDANSRHRIRMEYFQGGGHDAVARLSWRLPATTSRVAWTSEAADAIDYYFLAGPSLDQVIAGYRELTGAAPMFGKWAWGFWQCKEHYATQQELLDVARRYREMGVPLDGVIQDWYYWVPHPWGSHDFDKSRYPDFAETMRKLHAENVHSIISVWARFDEGSANWKELDKAGGLYPEKLPNAQASTVFQFYDPFNPTARKIYWEQMSRELFATGTDGWWLDASEAELGSNWGEFRDFTTGAGPGFKVFNAYPLVHTGGVYKGQRAGTSDKRVFILTRSAYAGQQRNAAVTWSGDVQGTWPEYRRQIPAGLNFSLSGIPYWNTDIGGFFGGDPRDPDYAELFTRWFQFGAFCPMFRVHGTNHPKEMWRFDAATQRILIAYDELRYHLLPYIYSTAWRVTHDGDTMMRPLVMDFPSDPKALDIPDQYLFGPALMVCPVTESGATKRDVYLPAGTTWVDFWTGRTDEGGQTLAAAAPIDTVPLYVRAGSIIPYGPSIQYAMESSDPIELRVYRGADGAFTLYEDEGDNYNYEKGKSATIPISWNEAARTLEIGKRSGDFPGMLKERTFRVVWVSDGHGAGIASTNKPDAVVAYEGEAVKISAPQ